MRRSLTLGLLLSAATAHADLRVLTQTEEYTSQPEGETSLQLWHTQGRATTRGPDLFEQRLQVEHGLTEHWDASVLVQIGEVAPGTGLHFERFSVQARYRFADRAEWPIDVLAFVDLGKQFGTSRYPLEGRLVLARDFDKLLLAANGIFTVTVGNDADGSAETELGWAGGASYQFHPKLRLGAETWGRNDDDVVALAGPVLALQPSTKLWVAVTAGFGITDGAERVLVRGILGIEL